MAEKDVWADDLLDRKDFAGFLTRTLVARTASISAKQGQRGWTVALDANWGAGKSFFVQRWVEDLRQCGHPVVFFDAWENDIGEEAAVALMAEINKEMDAWIQKLSKMEAVKKTATDLVVTAARKLRRSVMPAAKVVASGLLKKAIGSGIEDIFNGSAVSSTKSLMDVKTSADDALDKVFEVSLEEHLQRKSNVREFKNSLVQLIGLIEREANAKPPLFVFIDELDRCRPTYAISMLEEVKHIFGMDKVCFIVSTNLSQLRHSVGAVYGQSFDSELYLKRFFDQSIELPQAGARNLVAALLEFFDGVRAKRHFTAMLSESLGPLRSEHDAIEWVFDSFELDPRSQKQAFRIAECVCDSLNSDVIHTTYLFFLCVLSLRSQALFDELEQGGSPQEVCRKILRRDKKIHYIHYDELGKLIRSETCLSSVVADYVKISRMKLSDVARSSSYDVDLIAAEVIGEANRQAHSSERIIISDYFKLVRYAGYLKG
ncbi:MAG: P-loop NTPase fold protein [Pseudomonadota bacterium]